MIKGRVSARINLNKSADQWLLRIPEEFLKRSVRNSSIKRNVTCVRGSSVCWGLRLSTNM
jgi:hypothetical protein